MAAKISAVTNDVHVQTANNIARCLVAKKFAEKVDVSIGWDDIN